MKTGGSFTGCRLCKTIQERGYVMKEKGNPLLQIIRNVNDAVVVVLFLR